MEASINEMLLITVSLLVAGAATGLLAGIFGVGGGTIIVPVLYELFRMQGIPDEIRMPLCVGTSFAVIIPTSIRSFRAHYAKGAVNMELLRVWAVPILIGVMIGAVIARFGSELLFKSVFSAVIFLMAIRLLFGRDSWRLGDDLPKIAILRLYGGIVGFLSSLMGIGGGQMCSLIMTLYNRPIHSAVATSSGVGTLIAIPGAIGYAIAGWGIAAEYPDCAVLQFPLSIGYVSLFGFILLSPAAALIAPIGARIAHKLSKRVLEASLGCFLLLVCMRFIYSLM